MEDNKKNTSIRNLFAAAAAGSLTAAPASAQALAVGGVTATMAPWMLLAVPAVLGLWWLMRSIPKKPVRQAFPGISLLFALSTEEKTPKRAPWWQYIPITLASAAMIASMGNPIFGEDSLGEKAGPVLLTIDNGWTAGKNWKARTTQMQSIINQAEKEGRTILILPTAPLSDGTPVSVSGPMPATEARRLIEEMKPVPWPDNTEKAVQSLADYKEAAPVSTIWLSDGLEDSGTAAFIKKVTDFGKLSIFEDDSANAAHIIRDVRNNGAALNVNLSKAHTSHESTISITALDEAGKPVDQAQATFKAGEVDAIATFKLPADVSNQIARLIIEEENTAAATILLDERWRIRSVGLIDEGQSPDIQPLLNPSDYVHKALEPYADVKKGSVENLLERSVAVMVMTDNVALSKAQSDKVEEWVNNGGTLIRFAGPRLAANPDDKLLPLPIRQGMRTLGGDFSGSKEGKIGDIPQKSPFSDIAIAADINIKHGILPQPGADHDGNTWARLKDGTPLVTAKQQGKGQLVLFHVTADPSWSNLALSGTFVDMLRTAVATSHGVDQKVDGPSLALPALKTVDGFGSLNIPGPTVLSLTKDSIENCQINAKNPPGFYGDNNTRVAHNLNCAIGELKPLADLPAGVERKTYAEGEKNNELSGYLLAGALGFLLLDLILTLGQRRGSRGGQKPSRKDTALSRGPNP